MFNTLYVLLYSHPPKVEKKTVIRSQPDIEEGWVVLQFHHHHISRKTSSAGHRPPPSVAKVTGSVFPQVILHEHSDRKSTLLSFCET